MKTLTINREDFDADVFWSSVQIGRPDQCWLWRQSWDRYGYGKLSRRGRHYKAHRIAYVLSGGVLASGQVIDHLCRNRACVNPKHLEPTNVLTNTARGISAVAAAARAKLRGLCLNGHRLDEVGTHKNGPGRVCAECGRQKTRRHKALRLQAGAR